jgi:hypothetical protein
MWMFLDMDEDGQVASLFLLFFITLELRVECYSHLWALNTSPPRACPVTLWGGKLVY